MLSKEPRPIKADCYEEANQVDLIGESIKYGTGNLPEELLGKSELAELVVIRAFA
ncbi:MAG: hypothetical protein PHN61_00365 [Methanothrix sp.]|nr:hypothetical protein [Methanothrix sp.]